jgi:hypothetical protein
MVPAYEEKMELDTVLTWSIPELRDIFIGGYLTSPSFQRPVDENRVKALRQHITDTYASQIFHIPDVVLSETQPGFHIIDGQHRIKALIGIIGDDREKMKDFRLRVLVKRGLCEDDERKIFLHINMSVPCPGMYLQPRTEDEILNVFKNHIQHHFGHQASNSERCVSPNINVLQLMSSMSRKREDGTSYISDWFGDGTIVTGEDLIAELRELNTHIGVMLNSNNGFGLYKMNCPKRSNKHTEAVYSKLMLSVKGKPQDHIVCYLGFVDNDKITMCMFNKNKLF